MMSTAFGATAAVTTVASGRAIADGEIARHYDDLDPFYRDIWGEHVHHGVWHTGRESREQAQENLLLLIESHASFPAGAKIADIGCGYGGTARWFARRRSDISVVGYTLSSKQAEYARAQGSFGGRLSYHVGDWQTSGLEPASLDGAVAVESTEHFRDREAQFRETARVLKPGSRFVIAAWLVGTPASAWGERFLLEPICREGRLPSMGSADAYRVWLERAGFRVIDHVDITSKVHRTWLICFGRLLWRLMTRPEYRKFLFDPRQPNREFAGTLVRMWLALRTGVMRYAVMTAELR